MKDWQIKKFGDIYAIPSRNGIMRPSSVRGKGYKMINMGELFTYPRINNPNMELVELSDEEKERFGINRGDLLFARQSLVAEGAGKCSIVLYAEKPTTFESHLIRVRIDENVAYSLFWFYYFRSQAGFGSIQSLVNQVSAAGVRGSDIERLKVLYPPLPIQRKIAAILSAYDDLIENNKRRIAILEKMAEDLYREWFVRMRFPGHEKVKIIKGVPEGWEVKASLVLFNVLGGGTPKTDIPNYWGGEIPFFTPKDAHSGYFVDKTEKNITLLGLENCNSKLYPKNTIFITARGTVGKIVLALRPMAMNQSCYALEPKHDNHIYYYFLSMRNAVDIIKGTSNSGVFDNIITDSFKQFYLFKPDNKTLCLFNEIISPIFQKIETMFKTNAILTTSRDRFLSRLMSGKLDVENRDIQFPASMKDEVTPDA